MTDGNHPTDFDMGAYLVHNGTDASFFDTLKEATDSATAEVTDKDFPENCAVIIFKAVSILKPVVTREVDTVKLGNEKEKEKSVPA